MQRYFAQTLVDSHASLNEADTHHLVSVVRINKGERIEIVFDSRSYLAVIDGVDPLDIRIEKELENTSEPDIDLTLGFAILKGDHNDLVVEKGTENGVSTFIPYVSSRTIIKVKAGEEDNRIIRLRKIAKAASQQCRRDKIPDVSVYRDFGALIKENYDVKLFAYEGEAGKGESLIKVASQIEKGSRVLILVGPEGGFSEAEANKAKENGFRFVSLGRRILRGETASIVASAILSLSSEEN